MAGLRKPKAEEVERTCLYTGKASNWLVTQMCYSAGLIGQALRSLQAFCSTGLYASNRQALPSASQDSSLTFRHCLLLAVHFHTDTKPFILALQCFSADTITALGWGKK